MKQRTVSVQKTFVANACADMLKARTSTHADSDVVIHLKCVFHEAIN